MAEKKKFLNLIHKYLPSIYTIAVIAVTAYVSLRLRSWGNLVFHFETGLIVLILALGYLYITFKTGKHYLVAKTRKLTFLSGTATFCFMYFSLSVIVSDLILLGIHFLAPLKYEAYFKLNGILCIVFTIAITIYAGCHKEKIKTVNYHMSLPSMDGHYRIVLLSDLHTGYYIGEKHLLKVAEEVNRQNADIVIIAGDMINAGNMAECPDIDGAALAIAKFKSKEGTFACTGNHDPDHRDKDFRRFLKKADITLLTDEVYNNGRVNILGRNTRTRPRKSMEELKAGIECDMPLFIIDHDPMGIEEAKKYNADLIMCGHTHKGQVFPLNLFVRLLYSKEEFYGFHQSGRTASIVSSGAGYFSMPMRVGTDCEAVVIDIN